jgi:toxin ParE1/3/4
VRIRWLGRASRDLDHIEAYIALDDPHAAVRIVLRIIEAVDQLADYPGLGRPGRVEGTRELMVSKTPYLVPYRVRGRRVEILRVFHHAQKWPERL